MSKSSESEDFTAKSGRIALQSNLIKTKQDLRGYAAQILFLKQIPAFAGDVRLGYLDSNQDPQLQRLVCCHCTIPQCGRDCITIFLFLFTITGDQPKFAGFFQRNDIGICGFAAVFFNGLIPKIIRIGRHCGFFLSGPF